MRRGTHVACKHIHTRYSYCVLIDAFAISAGLRFFFPAAPPPKVYCYAKPKPHSDSLLLFTCLLLWHICQHVHIDIVLLYTPPCVATPPLLAALSCHTLLQCVLTHHTCGRVLIHSAIEQGCLCLCRCIRQCFWCVFKVLVSCPPRRLSRRSYSTGVRYGVTFLCYPQSENK